MSGKNYNTIKSAGEASANFSGGQMKSGQNNNEVGPAAGVAPGMTSNPASAANSGAFSSAAPANSSAAAPRPAAPRRRRPRQVSVFNRTAAASQSQTQKTQRQQDRKGEAAKAAEAEKAGGKGHGNASVGAAGANVPSSSSSGSSAGSAAKVTVPSNQAQVGAGTNTSVGTTQGSAQQGCVNGATAIASKQSAGTPANAGPKVVATPASGLANNAPVQAPGGSVPTFAPAAVTGPIASGLPVAPPTAPAAASSAAPSAAPAAAPTATSVSASAASSGLGGPAAQAPAAQSQEPAQGPSQAPFQTAQGSYTSSGFGTFSFGMANYGPFGFNTGAGVVGQSASSTETGSSGLAAGNSSGTGDRKRKRSANDIGGRQSTFTAATASAQQAGTAALSAPLPGLSGQAPLGTAPAQQVPVIIQAKRIKHSDDTHYWGFENRVALNPETGATVQFTCEVEMTSEEAEFDAEGDVKMSNAPEGTLQWTDAQLDEWRYVSGWCPAPPFHYFQTAVSWSSLDGGPSAVSWNGYGSGMSG